MLKFIAEKMLWANKLSKGDALDKSVEVAIANCPIGKVVLVEPHAGGRYFVRQGIIEEAQAVVTPKKTEPVKEKYSIPKKEKKYGKPTKKRNIRD